MNPLFSLFNLTLFLCPFTPLFSDGSLVYSLMMCSLALHVLLIESTTSNYSYDTQPTAHSVNTGSCWRHKHFAAILLCREYSGQLIQDIKVQ